MLSDDNWGWAWMAMIIAMAGFWMVIIRSVATSKRDSCAARGYCAGAVGRAPGRRGDPRRPVRRG